MPGELASFAGTLAKAFGWTVEYCLWGIPLAVAIQMRHCAILAAGADTIRPVAKLDPASLEAEIDAILAG